MTTKPYIPRCPVKLQLIAMDRVSGLIRDDFAEALAVYAGPAAPKIADENARDADTLVLFFFDEKPQLPPTAEDAHVYAVGIAPSRDVSQVTEAFDELEAACEEQGDVFCGGVALKHGTRIERDAKRPRMGIWRRARSEAVDRLIFDVLTGGRA